MKITIILFTILLFTSQLFSQYVTDTHFYPFPRVNNNLHMITVIETINCSSSPDSINYIYTPSNNADTLILNSFFTSSSWPGGTTTIDTIDLSNYFNNKYLTVIWYSNVVSEFYNTDSTIYTFQSFIKNIRTTPLPFNIKDIKPNNSITIYPNPSSKTVTINYPNQNKKLYNLTVTDNKALSLIKFNNVNLNNYSIDISKLLKGIYYINITDDKTNITKKIIIN